MFVLMCFDLVSEIILCMLPHSLCQRGDREAEIKGTLSEAPDGGED